ncbi:MAG: tetratricopeptide repeat protein [Candidatus Wallbacteria bacterium]
MSKMILLKKIIFTVFITMFLFTVTGCEDVVLGTYLQKGDKYTEKGNYQKAYECYMKAAEEYQARLGKAYSNKEDAKADANKLVEAYCKAGLTAEKLANDSGARAMFEKAAKTNYAIKESYYEKVGVKKPAGYYDRWVPGYYKDVYVDGHYEDVYVDGGVQDVYVDGYYKEIYVDPYYRQDGTYVNGYYKKVWVDGHYEKKQLPGHYEKVWKDGYYKKEYIDGHYEKVWEPEHMEYTDVYKERDASISIDSPYSVQAKAKLPASSTANAPIAVEDNSELKAAQSRMTAAYQAYIKAGSPAKGSELDTYKSAQEDYQKLLEAQTKKAKQ